MKENWKVKKEVVLAGKRTKEELFPDLEDITRGILLSRGVDSEKKKEEFLYPDYEKHTHSSSLLKDIDVAVKRILKARDNDELICIYGDYDVDGITSSTILFDFLSQVGVRTCTYLPDRNKEGYGLNMKAIDYIIGKKADLIVTVDCGITGIEEVEYANTKKLDVIITDHHFVPEEVPAAIAIINPKQKDDKYPEKMLAGVGVTFKFIEAIAKEIEGYDTEKLKWLLDLVAIGNVADCVPLLGENRTLTKFGLIVLARTQRVGLKQLFEVGRVNITQAKLPTGEQIGFQIAPRINAAGRMGNASAAYELLIRTKEETAKARVLALDIESQNKHRQKVTQEIIKEVEGRIDKDNLPAVVIEASEHWTLGIVGLAAGRVSDKYNRPSIVLQDKGDVYKGSCRSVPAFHLMEALTELKDLLVKFGGHSQAAGLTVEKKNFEKFKKEFTKIVESAKLSGAKKMLTIDSIIKVSEVSDKLLDELILLEPFGQANKKPVFVSQEVVVQEVAYLGAEKKHLKIWIADNADADYSVQKLELIAFGYQNNLDALKPHPKRASDEEKAVKNELVGGDKINIVYTLEENIWNGRRSIQGRIVDLEIIK